MWKDEFRIEIFYYDLNNKSTTDYFYFDKEEEMFNVFNDVKSKIIKTFDSKKHSKISAQIQSRHVFKPKIDDKVHNVVKQWSTFLSKDHVFEYKG